MDRNRKQSNLLYLDCTSGISGDMTVGALLDLGADKQVLMEALDSLPLQGYRIEIQNVIKSGLRACDFRVILDELHENHDHDMEYLHGSSGPFVPVSSCTNDIIRNPSDELEALTLSDGKESPRQTDELQALPLSDGKESPRQTDGLQALPLSDGEESPRQTDGLQAFHPQGAHGPAHHGRNLSDITEILKAGKLTPHALDLALRIFQILAESESQVHGKPLDEVHFHEVGAVDSIVDIAAVAVCIDNLEIEQVIIPSLTEGCGQIRCQHGLLPIPVPATTAIAAAHQLPLHISSIQGELITPTGAAIAAALRTHGQLPDEFRILRTGLGAGKRKYQTAGILRAMLIEDNKAGMDRIFVIETNMDDCTGEAMGFVMEELLSAGALDVFYTPIYMKKHRPAYQLSVMCTPEKRQVMEALIFRHTTTIGLRAYEVERTKLARKIISLETPWGMADVKCCRFEGEAYFYPESDSILKLAQANQISYTEMYHEVKAYAAKNYPIL